MKSGKSIFEKFHIGAYCLGKCARDEAHVKDLAECGIDVLFGVDSDKALLDLLHKYGVGAVVNGIVPGWFGADGRNAGKLRDINPIEKYIDGARRFSDHPAIVGIDIGDEPSSLDFPYYGKVAEALSLHFPDKLLYLNIYPSYGMKADAGAEQAKRELSSDSYRDYLKSFCENVSLPYLSIDHYPYSSDLDLFLSDLADAAEICRVYSRPLMTVLQVNSNDDTVFLSADQLRLEAYCALAYGARTISWACYSPGWWHNNVLDRDGNKTEQYEKLKAVNAELHRFTHEYEGYKHLYTAVLNNGESISIAPFGDIEVSAPAVIGLFENNSGSAAILVAPLEYSGSLNLSFTCGSSVALQFCTPKMDRAEKIDLSKDRKNVIRSECALFVFCE